MGLRGYCWERQCDSSYWTAVILKKINNGTEKALSEEMRHNAWGRGDLSTLHISGYHPITVEANLVRGGGATKSHFSEWTMECTVRFCWIPQALLFLWVSFWIIRKYMRSCCHGLFSDLSNKSNNSILSLPSDSWFTHIIHSTHKAIKWTPSCEEDSVPQVVDNTAQPQEYNFLGLKIGTRITVKDRSGILRFKLSVFTAPC